MLSRWTRDEVDMYEQSPNVCRLHTFDRGLCYCYLSLNRLSGTDEQRVFILTLYLKIPLFLAQDLSDAVEKVAALKSQVGGTPKTAPAPVAEARPSYAELSAMRERLQRSEVEKKSLEAELVS